MVEVMKIPPSKGSIQALLHLVPPTLQQATPDLCLCWRFLDTHWQVWVRLLWGHYSFLLGSGAQGSVSRSSVSFGNSMVGLMVTSSKRACTITRTATPRAPVPVADYF